jgi:hypothetical protein
VGILLEKREIQILTNKKIVVEKNRLDEKDSVY